MTPNQIKKAEQLLAKRKELLTLKDRNGCAVGEIRPELDSRYQKQPVLVIQTNTVSLETLERWIKQAKTVQKKNIL